MNRKNINQWYNCFVYFIAVGLLFGCNNAKSKGDCQKQCDSLVVIKANNEGEVFSDTVLSMKTVKSKELQCVDWKEPEKADILRLLGALQEVSGREWNDCYGDWNCGLEGELIFKGKKCYYRLDAGGWIILNDGNEQRYFACKNDSCWKYFPSECFCDKEGNVIDSP